ncbi:Pol polyprotein [Aphis craccivora]|uniref:Pol polyprotein n=1 Tax=Aphis craccivora TaxID=307492 RepID=A0A6G0XKJ3_APHCR|nr:Pol polyprotein [Aphis craccivora]
MENSSTLIQHEEVVTTRARIGHSRLTHLHLITKEDSPTCELCDKALTIKHGTLECPKFICSRQILGNPQTMQQALGEENTKNIYIFFKNIGLAKHKKQNYLRLIYLIHFNLMKT